MSDVKLKEALKPSDAPPVPARPIQLSLPPRRRRVVPLLVTLLTLAAAAGLGKAGWDTYMGTPWTRDGTVRAYVVTMASQVAGQIVALPVADNQFVHKGDLLMSIDPTNYRIAVHLAQAAAEQANVTARNAAREAQRRQELTTLSVTIEERQNFASAAIADEALYQQAVAHLDQASVDLARTEIRSPVNGWVTNLKAQLGDYATVGQTQISIVNADSFWVDAYFEETYLSRIKIGDPATIDLMGYSGPVEGHVAGVARGITVANAQPDKDGLASVNPIFTWVRLAQRIPVRIAIDRIPVGVRLVTGMTATVRIDR